MIWKLSAVKHSLARTSRRRAVSRNPKYEPLEQRQLLSINSGIARYNDVHDAPLIVDATYGVLADAATNSGEASSASLVRQPRHGVVTLNADGSFRYDPAPGYVGRDSFVFDETDGLGFHRRGIARLSVLSQWTPPQATASGAVQAFSSTGEEISVSNAKGPEGSALLFTVSASGTGSGGDIIAVSPGEAQPAQGQRSADAGRVDYDENFQTSAIIYGSGSFTVAVQTYDDERDMTMGDADAVFGVMAANSDADNLVMANGVGTIEERGGDEPICNCDCGCGKTMPGTSPAQGFPLAHTSSAFPGPVFRYNGGRNRTRSSSPTTCSRPTSPRRATSRRSSR